MTLTYRSFSQTNLTFSPLSQISLNLYFVIELDRMVVGINYFDINNQEPTLKKKKIVFFILSLLFFIPYHIFIPSLP